MKFPRQAKLCGCICLAICTASFSQAEVRLPKLLSSHAVLQRNTEVTLWGWASPGEEIRLVTDWSDPKSFESDESGNWKTQIKTTDDRKAHSISFHASNDIQLHNIRFGEVWLASGQSNMEMPLAPVSRAYTGIRDYKQEIARATYPDIRLFQVGNFSSNKPLEDVQAGNTIYGIPPAKCTWQSCSPESVKNFSSTAYFFARELHHKLDVPIGIIDASWGGTSAEAWTPQDGLRSLGYAADLKRAQKEPQNQDQKVPTRLYNGMIHPLRNMTLRGAIWYQGEGNASRADRYHELFTTMIGQWRAAFGNDDLPFYFTQIAPFRYQNINSADLRQAQLDSLPLKNTGMVVTMDIADLQDIHPKNKQEVGRRLALWALAKTYEQKVDCSGPIYRSTKLEGNSLRVSFDYAESGLSTSDGKSPSHFELAGRDEEFHPAIASIDGSEVLVSSRHVKRPVAVRYAYSNDALPNLIDTNGLPASSFRSDSR